MTCAFSREVIYYIKLMQVQNQLLKTENEEQICLEMENNLPQSF